MSMSDEKKTSGLPEDNPPQVPETHNREKRASAPTPSKPAPVNPGKPPVEPGDTLVVTAPKTTPGSGDIVPGSGSVTADLGKKTPSRIQAENSAAIHATARRSTEQLRKTQAEQAARASAAAATLAQAQARRDALTGYLKDIVNHALRKNYSHPDVIKLAHENNRAMEGEAMRLNAAKAERKAKKKAEEEVRKAEEALKAARRKKEEADRQKAETEKKLNQAQEQEARAKARADADKAAADKADAAAKAKAAAEARAKAKAAAEAKAREELFAKAGVKPAPVYTPQMVAEANSAMKAPGAMVLSQTPGSFQLAMSGAGTWTAAGDVAGNIADWFRKALSKLSVPEVSPWLLRLSLGSLWFHSEPAGEASQADIDSQTGRNWDAVFALNAQHLAGQSMKIEPGAKTVNLPVRGQLVNSNGQLTLELLKTGNNGIAAAVPVLNAVRDAATGLDKITVPAVGGTPARTILVNPVPAPARPSNTGNQKPVPVTPVHTGTAVKPVERPVATTTPVADAGGLRDFIYWQPDATGTGVEPVYVMLNDPLDSGRFTRKQLDRKYKHAVDFGISDTKKNSETLTKFRDAIEAHLADKETVEKGTYRREKGSKVYFNPKSMNVVILKANGDWLSGWKINPDADNGKIYLETGDL